MYDLGCVSKLQCERHVLPLLLWDSLQKVATSLLKFEDGMLGEAFPTGQHLPCSEIANRERSLNFRACLASDFAHTSLTSMHVYARHSCFQDWRPNCPNACKQILHLLFISQHFHEDSFLKLRTMLVVDQSLGSGHGCPEEFQWHSYCKLSENV